MKNPAIAPALSITLQSLGNISLRIGDHDATRRWGGVHRPHMSGRPVQELQEALTAVGALKEPADGQFGHHTQTALRRFQWYLNNMDYRLKLTPGGDASSGVICPFPDVSSGFPGGCDAGLGSHLAGWATGNFVTTTPLVRLNLSSVSNIDTSETFKVLDYPGAQDGEILVHQDFAGVISYTMNNAAKTAKVTLIINQTFRVHSIPPSGAVVPPASKSQHFIGHAIDLNIVDGETVNTAAMFDNGKETDNADTFISAVKKSGIRWGGDFNCTDPVHFDDFVSPTGEDYGMIFFFAQHCYDDDHPMRVVS
jgi:hypothetical protein